MGGGIANRCAGSGSAGQAFDICDRSEKLSFANRDIRPVPEFKPSSS